MTNRWRVSALGVGLVLATVLGGCGGDSSPTMMGGNSGMGSGSFGGSMMGSAPAGYHMRNLSCRPPRSLPGKTVYVMVGDMGMTHMMGGISPVGDHMMLRAAPASVPAGQISFEVANTGWRTHEMVVLPLPAGQSAGQRVPGPNGRVDESGALGEVSASCVEGSGDGIKSGSVGWVTLTLPPGNYEFVCNLENHYANGMYQAFTVT